MMKRPYCRECVPFLHWPSEDGYCTWSAHADSPPDRDEVEKWIYPGDGNDSSKDINADDTMYNNTRIYGIVVISAKFD